MDKRGKKCRGKSALWVPQVKLHYQTQKKLLTIKIIWYILITSQLNRLKPLTGTSTCLEHTQRAADGGIAVMEKAGNGPERAN